jgi:outer membrane protein assembly factor BamB
VEAINVADGQVRWSHPLAEGTPIAVGMGLVVEIAGGPYASAGTPAHPADAGKATLRALDEVSGEPRWATPVVVVPIPPANQYSPTVGNAVIAVPSTSRGTDIFDLATGTPLRREEGVVVASGDWLTRIEPNMFKVQAVSHADTGQTMAGVAGQPLNWFPDAEHALPVDDLFTFRMTDQNLQVFEMFDARTGATRWTLNDGYPIAHSSDGVLVTQGSTLRLLDRQTGAEIWEFASPLSSIGFQSAAVGNGVVLVVPGYFGD